ncbi:hypothetical protein [Xenorhabdus vietnamensis]|uniref:hypothetical protein n=1 Tax=Xenorhabdus vietnamensis TaxID=351656 RepID=UPI00111C676E|nr:hypothetical protein [Xenorhabdus vietnamensis]
MSPIIQSVKVFLPLAQSNGQGVAALCSQTLVRSFTSVPAFALSMVIQVGEAMPRWCEPSPRTLSESPPSILINGRGSRNE